MIALDRHPGPAVNVLARQGVDTLILLNLDGGQYYTLDAVGGRVWELCDGTRSVSAILAALCAEYDAPPAAIEADVLELLADLAREHLINE